jgi:hypothetical protein
VDSITLASAEDRRKFANAVHERVSAIEAQAVETELLRLAAQDATRDPKAETKPPAPDTPETLLDAMPDHVKNEARRMLDSPDLLKMILADIQALGVAGEKTLAVAVYLVGVSRLLDHPLAMIVQGQSSSGKSYVIERTSELVPPEAVVHAKQISQQALFHMPPGSLEHKCIVAGERSRAEGDEAAENTRALREMISSGELTKLITLKNPQTGQYETKQVKQKGPIAYIESTTLTRIFNEDANRCIMLSPDETEGQTRNILVHEAARRQGAARGNVSGILEKHHALQRMIRPRKVVIPFAEKLSGLFPVQRVEARRAFSHLLNMVEACALLHQYQRQQEHADGPLIASLDDYQIAKYLLDAPMARLLGKRMSDAARRYLDRLKGHFPGFQQFSTTDASKKEFASDRAVRGWLSELADAGFLDIVDSARGRATTWKFSDNPPSEAATAALPDSGVIQ